MREGKEALRALCAHHERAKIGDIERNDHRSDCAPWVAEQRDVEGDAGKEYKRGCSLLFALGSEADRDRSLKHAHATSPGLKVNHGGGSRGFARCCAPCQNQSLGDSPNCL